jgi:DNA-directed RNA polymerase subunit RPC12/RpoP
MTHPEAYGEPEENLQCARCGYELRSLPTEVQCPECGLPIRVSIERKAEVFAPKRNLPHLKLTLLFLLLATLTGSPALIGFAILKWLNPRILSGNTTLEEIHGIYNPIVWLLLVGSLSPLCTILSVPRELSLHRYRKRMVLMLVLLGGGGSALAFHANPLDTYNFEMIAGYTLSALACAIGLTTASGYIGAAVPQWKHMGSARQTATPMIGVILLIGALRLILGLTVPHTSLYVGMEVALIASEFLLVIGTCYLLTNRLWLAWRLIRSLHSSSPAR